MNQEISVEEMDREVTFDAIRLPVLEEKIAKLNKRARRLHVPEITFEVIARGEREVNGGESKVRTVTVRIVGNVPCLEGGWQFVGSVEHLDGENLIHGDDERLAVYRNASPVCDHCKKVRSRKKTVIVENADGEIAQVGASCMKDFFGYYSNPEYLIDYVAEFKGLDGGSGRVEGYATIQDVMAAAVAAVRVYGWKALSAYGPGLATASIVGYKIGFYRIPTDKVGREILDTINAVEVGPADYEAGDEIIAWAQSVDPSSSGNYIQNLRVVCQLDVISSKHLGLACSAVSAKAKADERDIIRREAKVERAASEWIGEIGERLDVSATVKFIREIDGDYGISFLISMVTDDGNVLKTFNSGKFGRRAKVGDRFVGKATVKDHKTYNDARETMLTRASGELLKAVAA